MFKSLWGFVTYLLDLGTGEREQPGKVLVYEVATGTASYMEPVVAAAAVASGEYTRTPDA